MENIKSNLKTLFGKVKIDLIPNVSEFHTFIESYSEFAAIFGLKSPNRKDTLVQFNELKKANKYIAKNMLRLMKYAAAGEMAKHDYLANILLTRSDACLVASIHHKAGKPTKGNTRVWYLDDWCKVVSLVNKTRKIARDLSCKLELKRVWIDKKLGDYARGLGVPKLHWRVHTFQENRIIENTLVAKNMLTSWQHGGRSFKGTHTAWEQIMLVLRDKPFIYEFDIKGFYDNIVTKNIAPFLGELMASRVQEIVNTTKPTEFQLPPLESDKAYQEINKHADKFVCNLKPLDYPDFEFPEGDYRVITEKQRIEEGLPEPTFEMWPENVEPYLDEETGEIKLKISMGGSLGSLEDRETISYKDNYKDAMEGNLRIAPITNPLWQFPVEPFVEKDREQGREKWKNLSQEGRGFPQGLSFSPILSTNALERALPGVKNTNLTMYMDDGLIYGESKDEVLQIINKLEAALESLGITLAPEKSGWIRENWSFVKESKFLGIKVLENESGDPILISQTRNGTSRPFPNPLEREDYLEFCETLEIAPSTARIIHDDILLPKGKEEVIYLGKVMGNILNYMYAPDSSRNEQEWKIMEGRMKAIQRILRNKHKTLQKLEKYFPEPITRPGLGERLEAVRLTSVSSIASIRLLRYLKEKRNRRERA
jgi:hypothetical protein